MSVLSKSDRERIRELTDRFRKTFVGGRVVATEGVNALSANVQVAVLQQVRQFDQFDRDNDPRGEHDFGSFEVEGLRFFFKIDYYNLEVDGGSEDPADPARPRAYSR